MDQYLTPAQARTEMHSINNQRILSDFWMRNVVTNLYEVVNFVERHDPDLTLDFLGYDHEAAANADGWEESDEDDRSEGKYRKLNEDYDPDDKAEVDSDGFLLHDPEWKYVYSDTSSWEELCDEENVPLDGHEREVLEHWAVSEHLADKLREQGEVVVDLLGFKVWGRCTSGQAVYLDGVIGCIAAGLEILSGQRNEWKRE